MTLQLRVLVAYVKDLSSTVNTHTHTRWFTIICNSQALMWYDFMYIT